VPGGDPEMLGARVTLTRQLWRTRGGRSSRRSTST
jgi:hypothetical protein